MIRYLNFTTNNVLLDQGIENYLIHGFEPGGFLTAVLSNNLFLAASRADHVNYPKLSDIAKTVYHNMPPNTIGSYEIVKAWCLDQYGCRTEYAAQQEKAYVWKVLKGEVCEKIINDPPF